ncbi:BAR-domain-containing protein [Ascodesmis nigricans]|uniref:BAR-domain-containing protein n=1 Tax=Ascodesmis nigricans TaxID=341454 RepID=A0A4S2N5T6_9PEZI|nr:BAR-domain-containing protein [Ascodesmis nigricans]
MNMNKKLDRFKQWAGERMGGEAKTSTSDEFKSLEMEMDLRQNGMDKLHTSMNTYIKSMSQRKEGDDREKMLPVDVLAQAMIAHGEEFESDSLFGTCLIMMGQANENIARVQDSYVASASESWLESLERSLAQMKEYQAARRKLESRRLAYDATLSKMQKQKKEDFRLEEELRSQRIKYEESSDDVYRRMGEIQDAEAESMTDLGAFLDAELEYHERCAEILANLRRQWPAGQRQPIRHRSRSTTAHAFGVNGTREESPPPPPQPEPERIRSVSRVSTGLSDRSVERERSTGQFRLPTPDLHGTRPSFQRTNSASPAIERSHRTEVTPTRSRTQEYDGQNDSYSPPDRRQINGYASSPSRQPSGGERVISRSASNNTLSNVYNAGSVRKVAPPPPPARKKPPPPPPMKKPNLNV